MYRYAFPPCPVSEESRAAVPFGHLGSKGAIPAKCRACDQLLEGECTRAYGQLQAYAQLDHGPCSRSGPTTPVELERGDHRVRYVPKKCVDCPMLQCDNLQYPTCRDQHQIWGDFPRSLDWGDWTPQTPFFGFFAAESSLKLVRLTALGSMIEAVQEYRRLNPGADLRRAMLDVGSLRHRLSAADIAAD